MSTRYFVTSVSYKNSLRRKLSYIAKDLEDLKRGNQVLKYVMVNNESGILLGIVEDINTAIIDYQLALQQDTYDQILSLIVSLGVFLLICDNPERVILYRSQVIDGSQSLLLQLY